MTPYVSRHLFLSFVFFLTLLSTGFASDPSEERVPMGVVYRKLLGYEETFQAPQPIEPASGCFKQEGGLLQTRGLRMSIPQEAVLSPVSFSINQAPPHIEPPLNMKALTPMYEMQPHDVRFLNPITLTFDVPPTSNPLCLFVQKESDQSKLLDEWILIPPTSVTEGSAIFDVKSFSFAFVGTQDFKAPLTPKDTSQLTLEDQKYNLVRPGLTYRVQCSDETCESHTKSPQGIMIHRGFSQGKPFNPIDDLEEDEANLLCVACQKPITDTESIEQVVLFQTQGRIDYKERRRGSSLQNKSFDTGSDKIIFYSQNKGQIDDYNSFKITAKPLLINPLNKVATLTYDKNGNPVGNLFDLGADGAFKHIKLLIGNFVFGFLNTNDELKFNHETFKAGPGKALDDKGFDWHMTEDENEFLEKLPQYYVAWIISCYSSAIKNPDFVDKVTAFHRRGGNLMIWEDNDAKPKTHSVEVICRLFEIQLGGNDLGRQIMKPAAMARDPLTFDRNHPMAVGLHTIYEGSTICFPDKNPLPAPVKVFAISSASKPNIMYVEKDAMGKNSGRIVIDCGFTKLFSGFWDETPGTSRYVKNATCWLAGATTE